MSVQKEKPTDPVSDTYKPTGTRDYTVSHHDSWKRLAQELHMHPWDLIEFNFPGMKPPIRNALYFDHNLMKDLWVVITWGKGIQSS
jgi:hypothetical protein